MVRFCLGGLSLVWGFRSLDVATITMVATLAVRIRYLPSESRASVLLGGGPTSVVASRASDERNGS